MGQATNLVSAFRLATLTRCNPQDRSCSPYSSTVVRFNTRFVEAIFLNGLLARPPFAQNRFALQRPGSTPTCLPDPSATMIFREVANPRICSLPQSRHFSQPTQSMIALQIAETRARVRAFLDETVEAAAILELSTSACSDHACVPLFRT